VAAHAILILTVVNIYRETALPADTHQDIVEVVLLSPSTMSGVPDPGKRLLSVTQKRHEHSSLLPSKKEQKKVHEIQKTRAPLSHVIENARHDTSRLIAQRNPSAPATTSVASGLEPIPETGRLSAAAKNIASSAERRETRNRLVRHRLELFKYYPASARRRGIEGAVDVSFSLNVDGQARGVHLVSGSGYAILDDAAMRTVQRAEPFPVHEGFYQFRLLFRRS